MNYSAWVADLRTPLEGRRAEIVNEALKVAGNTVGSAKANFKFDQFDMWCQAVGVDSADEAATFSSDQFVMLYTDVSMGIFEDDKFVKLVEDTWGLNEAAHLKVDPKTVEALVNALRLAVQNKGTKKHNEEFVLREVFRQFDRNSDGVLTLQELGGMFSTLGINADAAHLQALLNRMDTNGKGARRNHVGQRRAGVPAVLRGAGHLGPELPALQMWLPGLHVVLAPHQGEPEQFVPGLQESVPRQPPRLQCRREGGDHAEQARDEAAREGKEGAEQREARGHRRGDGRAAHPAAVGASSHFT